MQSKSSTKEEWNKMMQCTHTMNITYYQKNAIMPFAATWIDLEIIILSKVSQKEKDKYHMRSVTCGI